MTLAVKVGLNPNTTNTTNTTNQSDMLSKAELVSQEQLKCLILT